MRTMQEHNEEIIQLLCNRVVAQQQEILRLRSLLADVALGMPLDRVDQEILDRIIKRKGR